MVNFILTINYLSCTNKQEKETWGYKPCVNHHLICNGLFATGFALNYINTSGFNPSITPLKINKENKENNKKGKK